MKFGLLLSNQQPLGSDQRVALVEQLELLHVARGHGWDAVYTGQHYLGEGLTHVQPLPYLARLAADAGDMRVGVSILLLALQNPLEVAENYASLDVMTGGRLIFGVGLGYRQVEYDAFGIDPKDKVERFEANLDIVSRLWAGEKVDADHSWCRLNGAQLSFLPIQRPRPSLWMAANSDAAVKRAARLADTWIINPHATFDTVSRQLNLFHDERRRVGRVGAPAELPALREVICAPDREIAHDLASKYLAGKYQVYSKWGQDKVMPDRESFDVAYEELSEQRFIVGTPEDCVRALRPWIEELGVDNLIVRTRWSGMPVVDAINSVRLLSNEVFPQLRDLASARGEAERWHPNDAMATPSQGSNDTGRAFMNHD